MGVLLMRDGPVRSMASAWDMDPAMANDRDLLGTGLAAALWCSPDPHPRILSGIDGDVHVLAYHVSPVAEARMTRGGLPIYQSGVTAGSWLVVPPGTKGTAPVSGKWEVLHLFIPSSFVARIDAFMSRDLEGTFARQVKTLTTDPFMGSACSRLLTRLRHMPDDTLAVEAACAEVLTALQQHSKQNSVSSGGLPAWRIKRVKEMMRRLPAEELKVDALADAAGLSRWNFSRTWKTSMGDTL